MISIILFLVATFNKMSVGAQMVVVLKAFVEYCVSLVFAHPFEVFWLDVSGRCISSIPP